VQRRNQIKLLCQSGARGQRKCFSPVPKKVERSEEEKREIEANLEKLSERQTATLSAAYSKKKKRR